MKNIRAYLTTAAISLMLVAASAFLAGNTASEAAVCVPLLFGLVFSWSAVKAALAMADEDITVKAFAPVPASTPVFQLRFA